MKDLDKRKAIASKVLGVGKNKIRFDSSRLAEIKEAITRQDIRDLFAEGIITLKSNIGRMKKKRRKTQRGPGKIKKKIRKRKEGYVKLVRKLRRHVKELKKQNAISREEYILLRKRIKAKEFKSKNHLKEHIEVMKKEKVTNKENK